MSVAIDPCPPLSAEVWNTDAAEEHEAPAALTAALERACLVRLAHHWEQCNGSQLEGRLRPPSLQLHAGEHRWGAWDPRRRLISIARRQVLYYTWESAVETLKHEMAHQWVSEVEGEPDEPPHGPAFRAACARLGCDPAPRGDGGTPLLRPGGLGARPTAADGRLARVMKLLQLADNNPDEHEARAAFARASELMLRYNLDVAALPRGEVPYISRTIGAPTRRVASYRYHIGAILATYYFVQTIWVETYDVRRASSGTVLELLGTPANVDMAHYVHDCLERQSLALWRAYKQREGVRDRRAKRQYLEGLLTAFGQQLRHTTARSEERGLVWVGDPGLKAFFRARHPRVSSASFGGVDRTGAHQAGTEAGRSLRLHQPLGERGGGTRGLLPG